MKTSQTTGMIAFIVIAGIITAIATIKLIVDNPKYSEQMQTSSKYELTQEDISDLIANGSDDTKVHCYEGIDDIKKITKKRMGEFYMCLGDVEYAAELERIEIKKALDEDPDEFSIVRKNQNEESLKHCYKDIDMENIKREQMSDYYMCIGAVFEKRDKEKQNKN